MPLAKKEAYRQGLYRFKAPGVCSIFWSENDWIAFVDSYNGWTVQVC